MKAIKIKMKAGCSYSYDLLEIDSIYITDCSKPGYYKKADVYDAIKYNNAKISVNIYPYPDLIGVVRDGEKYVRSLPNDSADDNLLALPRE